MNNIIKDILIKSAPITEQIIPRKKENNNFEIQLLPNNQSVNDVVNVIRKNEINAKVIHPVISKQFDVYLHDGIYDTDRSHYLTDAFEIANKLGTEDNKVIVVIHDIIGFNTYLTSRELPKVSNFIKSNLIKYPNIIIGLENIIPVLKHTQADGTLTIRTANAVTDEIPKLVRCLKNDLRSKGIDESRIISVLDVIHAQITINTYKPLGIHLTIEDYFNWFKDTTGLVHLGVGKNLGYDAGEHGAAIDKEHSYVAEEFINLYKKYKFNCPITLEVFEENYLDCANYKESYKTMESILKVNENIMSAKFNR